MAKSWESNPWVWAVVIVGTSIVAGVATAYINKVAGLKKQASIQGKYQFSVA